MGEVLDDGHNIDNDHDLDNGRKIDNGQKIWLIGMPGSGKSTIGRLLAGQLAMDFVDLDRQITAQTGLTISEIFSTQGESEFRRLEAQALHQVATRDERLVVALGGGAVLEQSNREVLAKDGTTVWLKSDLATLRRRIGSGASRPLLRDAPLGTLEAMHKERTLIYESLAKVAIPTDGRTPMPIVRDLVASLSALGLAGDHS